ncbi:hypothetical protein D3C86_1231250 [compost metagenome]
MTPCPDFAGRGWQPTALAQRQGHIAHLVLNQSQRRQGAGLRGGVFGFYPRHVRGQIGGIGQGAGLIIGGADVVRDSPPLRDAADLPAIVGKRAGRDGVRIGFPFSVGHAIDQDFEIALLGDRGDGSVASGAGLHPH